MRRILFGACLGALLAVGATALAEGANNAAKLSQPVQLTEGDLVAQDVEYVLRTIGKFDFVTANWDKKTNTIAINFFGPLNAEEAQPYLKKQKDNVLNTLGTYISSLHGVELGENDISLNYFHKTRGKVLSWKGGKFQ